MTLPPLLQKYLNKLTHKRTKSRLHSTRDWFILLAIAFIALIGSVIWNVWFFSHVLSGKEDALPGEATEGTDTSVVEEVHTLFNERAEEEGRYRNEYRFIDPSR